MTIKTSTRLTPAEIRQYEASGFQSPIRVLTLEEASSYRQKFLNYREQNRQILSQLPINQYYQVFSETHFAAGWVHWIVTHPGVLDAVESILGPNILAWNTNWFAKMPGEKTFISWHQDGMYWKLSPFKVVTAWVALSPSNKTNGCLRVIPGTHLQPALPHTETYNSDNALSRGQDIAASVDESKAVDLELEPGEMSLHHLWIAHGSKPNQSLDAPRIGIAIRYVATEVRQESPTKPLAILVRGRDEYGHFELLPPATREDLLPGDSVHRGIIRRIRATIMQDAAS